MLQLPDHQPIDTIPVCRLCGHQSLDASYLDTYSETGRFVVLAVQKYLEIEVGEKNICLTCSQKVEEWNAFYLKCHEVEALFKQSDHHHDQTLTLLRAEGESPDASKIHQQSSDLAQDSVDCHLSKLVEELVQDAAAAAEHKAPPEVEPVMEAEEAARPPDEPSAMDEEHCDTEDEYEEDLSSEGDEDSEDDDESPSEDSQDGKPRKTRHKKFIFTIPFLERKLDRKFTAAEKAKLQKYIAKRQNTLICKPQQHSA